MTSITAPLAGERAETSAGRFYVKMAWVCLAIAVIGFLPTYWIPLARGAFDRPPILHLHALAFYGWTLFFVSQASLVSRRRIARHRELGVVGVALATALLFIGMAAALSSLRASIGLSSEAAVREFVRTRPFVAFRPVPQPGAHPSKGASLAGCPQHDQEELA